MSECPQCIIDNPMSSMLEKRIIWSMLECNASNGLIIEVK